MKKIIVVLLVLISNASLAKTEIATFAGGCFWCMEPPYEKLVGVKAVISGYAGGTIKNPTYKMVAGGKTKHREAVQVHYDPALISYERLVEIFWMNIDPTDSKGQFVDKGFQYTSAIFSHNQQQFKLAQKSLQLLKASKKFKTVVTPIINYTTFYKAEDYHQDYYKRTLISKTRYKYYRNASGRDDFIAKHWKKGERFSWNASYVAKSTKELKNALKPLQFQVTQHEGTEPPFKNEFWNNKQDGIYVDIATGEPLFSSKDKFKSGTGWPSFTKPINPFYIMEYNDSKFYSERVEVRSRVGNSHLGHVFKDGPSPLGLRYCINSASLKFIPKEKMKASGYQDFLSLF